MIGNEDKLSAEQPDISLSINCGIRKYQSFIFFSSQFNA